MATRKKESIRRSEKVTETETETEKLEEDLRILSPEPERGSFESNQRIS